MYPLGTGHGAAYAPLGGPGGPLKSWLRLSERGGASSRPMILSTFIDMDRKSVPWLLPAAVGLLNSMSMLTARFPGVTGERATAEDTSMEDAASVAERSLGESGLPCLVVLGAIGLRRSAGRGAPRRITSTVTELEVDRRSACTPSAPPATPSRWGGAVEGCCRRRAIGTGRRSLCTLGGTLG